MQTMAPFNDTLMLRPLQCIRDRPASYILQPSPTPTMPRSTIEIWSSTSAPKFDLMRNNSTEYQGIGGVLTYSSTYGCRWDAVAT